MKNNIILIAVLSFMLFISVITQFEHLLLLLAPKNENVQFISRKIESQFKLAVIFSIIIGLIPVFLYLTWWLTPIKITKNKILSVIIILTFMIVLVILRQQAILNFGKLTDLKTVSGKIIPIAFFIEDLHYEYYLLGGLILGCVVSFLVLKDKEKSIIQ